MRLIEWIELIDPWTWLTVGLMLALADIFAGSYFLAFLGASIASNYVWDSLGAPGELQLVLVAAAAVATALFARRIVGHRKPSVHDEHFGQLEGLRGRVLWIDPEEPSRGRGAIDGRGEWLIYTDGSHLLVGEIFVVVSSTGQRLRVAQGQA